jgi:hypothetical protein
MRVSIHKLLVAMMILAASCTSGKNNPVDSHPGSGSVKGGSDTKEEKSSSTADSSKNDSTNKM